MIINSTEAKRPFCMKAVCIMAIFLLMAFLSCQRDFSIPETKFDYVWKEYHNRLFTQGLEKQLVASAKKQILLDIAKDENIPSNRIERYILQKYPQEYQLLFSDQDQGIGADN